MTIMLHGMISILTRMVQLPATAAIEYVAAKATYIRLLQGKIGFLGFSFRP